MKRPSFHAPSRSGERFFSPSPDDWSEVLETNRRHLHESNDLRIDGIPLPELRRTCRRDAIWSASRYLGRSGEPVTSLSGAGGLLVSGHQPEFSHPGVWLKHFALYRQALACGCTPLHLIVDTDTLKSAALPIPRVARDPAEVALTELAFDEWEGETPHEDRSIMNLDLLENFGKRFAESSVDWGFRPILSDLWPMLSDEYHKRAIWGEAVCAVRRHQERRWGIRNLELPVSHLSDTEAFRHFARHILDDLPNFVEIHNTCLREYRQANGIRSRNHPASELVADPVKNCYETPFWRWSPGQERRGRWMAKPRADWPDFAKIRPRALILTMFVRLCLADGFIHGIGGGIYDTLTDMIIREWLKITPPNYFVVSGTLRLPFEPFPSQRVNREMAQRRLRDFDWKPEQTAVGAEELKRAKEEWIRRSCKPGLESKRRFRELQRLTAELRSQQAGAQRAEATAALARIDHELRANAILGRRDFAWLLYPEEMLRDFLN